MYESHPVKFKVTGAKKLSLFQQCKTLIGNHLISVRYRAMKFVCRIGFTAVVDQME